MTIKRAPRPEINFYMLDKRISEDREIGWAARGILIYLLGKPDNWEISVQDLINQTEGSNSPSGKDGVYAILKQLREVGYIRLVRDTDGEGRFVKPYYEVSETPKREMTVSGEDTKINGSKPERQSPKRDNPTLTSNDLKQGSKVSNIDCGDTGASAQGELLPGLPVEPIPPSPSLKQAFDAFWEMYPRKVAKDYAFQTFKKALKKHPEINFGAIMSGLRQSVELWRLEAKDPDKLPHASTWLNQCRFNDDLAQEIENAEHAADQRNHRGPSRTGQTGYKHTDAFINFADALRGDSPA